MNVGTKLGRIKSEIEFLARHDDEDASVRKTALAMAKAHIDAEVAAIDERVAAKTAEMLGAPDEAPQEA